MRFSQRLKQLRLLKDMTQEELSKALNISPRTIQNYELGQCYPRKQETLMNIAGFFDVDVKSLMSNEDVYIMDAAVKGGSAAKKDVMELVNDIGGMFAGGELSEEDKDKVMRTINDLYWKSKEKNKRYSNKTK